MSVTAGGSATIYYTVKLSSGTTWGTSISASNAAALSADGISLSFNNSYGNPTYSGTMTISTSSSTAPGTYSIDLAATGDDPSSTATVVSLTVAGAISKNTTVPTTTVAQTTVTKDYFGVISKATFEVNGTKGGTFTLNNVITAVIPANTFVLDNGSTIKLYNFSIIDFSVPSSLQGPNSTLSPYGAYAFAVNEEISPSIEFVNASDKPQPIKSIVVGSQNDTSWTYFGGVYNGSAYSGGKYVFADVWSHPNSSVMVNDQFFKPVLWVFEEPAKPAATVTTTVQPIVSKATTVPTTVPAKLYPGSNEGIVAAIVIVIIIIALIAVLALRKKK
ncbi:MAG: hypothetical protein QXN59_00740 [Candidatus Micrarchaeaceae archaeon]